MKRFTTRLPQWVGGFLLLLALGDGGFSGQASAGEYVFNGPNGPLLWDFSGAYPPPLSTTLHQYANGSLVAESGAWGQVSGTGAFVGLNLSSASNPDYWYYVDSYTQAYVFSVRCTTSLVLDPSGRLLTGQRQCTTLSQWYGFFLFTWVPYRNLTTNSSTDMISVPLPDGVDGRWKLALDTTTQGGRISGSALVTLGSSNTIPFQVAGADETATRSALTLQGEDYANSLNVVTLGPEMALQSMHGMVAGQSVDYDAPAGVSALTLQVNGNGAVKPFANGQVLALGQDYTVTAKPSPGNLFSNWVVAGSIATNPTLRFTMISNLVVEANFVTNFFIPAGGVYSGLFYETNSVRWESAGFFTLKLASSGAFSGKISLEGRTHSFSGRFDINGQTRVLVRRGGKPALTVSLWLDSPEKEIFGAVSDGDWLAELSAPRAFSSSGHPVLHYEGGYTLVIPGGDSGPDHLGDGYATFWIDFYGTIHVSGKLADGTALTRSAKVSHDGQWPLYVPLYHNKGSMLGWITFSNQSPALLGGDVIWFKPANSTGRLYPTGFTNQTFAAGSAFRTPDWVGSYGKYSVTNGVLLLTGGNLPIALSHTFDGGAANAIGATLKWDSVSGAVSGSFIHPATARRVSLQGALLQNENTARGFFLGTNESGSFVLGP